MNPPISSILKRSRIAAAALAVAVVPFAAGTASASATTTKPATTAAATSSFTSVISIGGYVFYNLTYLEAVAAWQAAVAAAPAGYQPPAVTSVSVSTTVSGTVADGDGLWAVSPSASGRPRSPARG